MVRKHSGFKTFLYTLGIALIVVFVIAGVVLIFFGLDDLRDMKSSSPTGTIDGTKPETEHVDYNIESSDELFSNYKSQCEDVVARLFIPDTTMETPVVNSSYYFRRDLSGAYSTNGIPFFDEEGGEFLVPGQNAVVYGHRLDEPEDFGMLKSYVDQNFYDLHPTVYFETDDGITEWQIISVYALDVTKDSFDYLGYNNLSSEGVRNKYVAEITDRSLVDTGAHTIDANTCFVTLSTCHYEVHPENGRLVVVAIYNGSV